MIEMNFGNIALILGVIGSLLGIIQQMRSMKKSQEDAVKLQAEQQTKLEMRLAALEKAVDAHNQYAEKFASLTEAIIAMKTDLSWIKDSMEK